MCFKKMFLNFMTYQLVDLLGDLNIIYTVCEIFLAIGATLGNAIVIYVFFTNRRLRIFRNYYLLSLAIADFLVGSFGIPLAILTSFGIPENFYGCLFSLSILLALCTISIMCLLAVSIDRYLATKNPLGYHKNMNAKTSIGIILSCWILGAILGFLPLFGWNNKEGFFAQNEKCYFREVIDYDYLVLLYFLTIILPTILMIFFYGSIYHIVKSKIGPNLKKRLEEIEKEFSDTSNSFNSGGSLYLVRKLAFKKRQEAKIAKKLGIIVLFFMVSWIPLNTINFVQAFCPDCPVPLELLNFTIILSHANSALNPLLFAYHLKEFRITMKKTLCSIFEFIFCGLIKPPSEINWVSSPPESEFPSGNKPNLSMSKMEDGKVLYSKNKNTAKIIRRKKVEGADKYSVKFLRASKTRSLSICPQQIQPRRDLINNKNKRRTISTLGDSPILLRKSSISLSNDAIFNTNFERKEKIIPEEIKKIWK